MPVSGHLASPLRARPIWAGARGTFTRRLRDPPRSRNADNMSSPIHGSGEEGVGRKDLLTLAERVYKRENTILYYK
jgi:hypothetical protein